MSSWPTEGGPDGQTSSGWAPIAGLVLAAGGSRRLGTPKQLMLDESGETLVVRAVRTLLAARCTPLVVVTGGEADAVESAVRHALGGRPVRCVHNPAWESGMGTSIARGVGELPHSASAVLIATCDMPDVTVSHLRELVALTTGGRQRVASAYGNPTTPTLGIPAVLPRGDWPTLAALTGDVGARELLRAPGTLSVFLRRGMFDLDTPDDVAAWRARIGRNATNSPAPSIPYRKPSMPTLAQTALADFDHEFANTRRMLERIPEAHLDFTPHEKSWPLGKLAHHLAEFPMFGEVTVTQPGLDFAAPQPPRPPMPTTAEGFVALFDADLARFRAALDAASDASLLETWTMSSGAHVIMAMPRLAVLRGMVISHMIHHRAQLTIYYRMLNVSVPGLYGPSADEAM